MPTIKINPKFQALIPPLAEEERDQLEKCLVAYGCTDPIVLWNQGNVILDGHNRFEICERRGIPYQTVVLDDLQNENEAIYWIVMRQFGRRNLNAYQRAELATALVPVLRELAKQNLIEAAKKTNEQKEKITGLAILPNPSIKKINVREKVAELSKVSDGTMGKINAIQKEATEEVKQALREGKTTIHAEAQKIKAKKKKAANKEKSQDELNAEEQRKCVAAIFKLAEKLRAEIEHCRHSYGFTPAQTADLFEAFENLRDEFKPENAK
jgi:hypothetical protein